MNLMRFVTYYSFTGTFPPKPAGVSEGRYRAACGLAKSYLAEAELAG